MALPRVRCCNCTRARSIGFSLRKGDGLANWTVIAKDGADLPPDQVQTAKAQFTITVGETRDVTFSTPNAEDIQLERCWQAPTLQEGGCTWRDRQGLIGVDLHPELSPGLECPITDILLNHSRTSTIRGITEGVGIRRCWHLLVVAGTSMPLGVYGQVVADNHKVSKTGTSTARRSGPIFREQPGGPFQNRAAMSCLQVLEWYGSEILRKQLCRVVKKI